MRVLHVVNYGWPHVDGYTARGRSLTTAQAAELGIDVQVAVSPFGTFARATDPELTTPVWGPGQHQVLAVPAPRVPSSVRSRLAPYERPALHLAPFAEDAFARGLDQLVTQIRPDVVHAHHPAYVGRAARKVARRRGLPLVYEVRCFNGDYDLDARNPYVLARGHAQNRLELALARSADQVVTISDGLAARLVDGGVPQAKVTVVRNAVDTSLWTPLDRTTEPGVLRVGYATTFEAMEGLDNLVEAAALARGPLADRGLRLSVVLAGAGRDWDRISDLVRDRGLGDTVSLPGFLRLPELRALYAGLDLFVVPRRAAAVATDTTPLKPLEALAAGLPVLATDLPALRELMAGHTQVRHVPPTPAGLADGLLSFASEPWQVEGVPDLGERSWARQVHRYTAVYDAVGAHV